jgi:hypothetical protein
LSTTEPVDWLERLTAVLPPPPQPIPPRTEPWADIEARLGFRLPDDYKRIADRYGNGSSRSYLLTPAGPQALNLWTSSATALDIWRTYNADDPHPEPPGPIFDGVSGLFPLAGQEGSWWWFDVRDGIAHDDTIYVDNRWEWDFTLRGPLARALYAICAGEEPLPCYIEANPPFQFVPLE